MSNYEVVESLLRNGTLVLEFLLQLQTFSQLQYHMHICLFLGLHQPIPNRIVHFEASGKQYSTFFDPVLCKFSQPEFLEDLHRYILNLKDYVFDDITNSTNSTFCKNPKIKTKRLISPKIGNIASPVTHYRT